MRRPKGSGSLRPLRPGVWEVRVALGVHPVSGRSTYRSISVHGDREVAEQARARWAAKAELVRAVGRPRPGVTVGEVLVDWWAADHGWRPSTVAGNRSGVTYLVGDPVARRRAVDLTGAAVAEATRSWRTVGASDATVWARLRVLRSAVGWAWGHHIIDVHPLETMPSTPHVGTRMHAPTDQVREIIGHAERRLSEARSGDDPGGLHRAEQIFLLCRLAADSGARRGEMAGLQVDDLDGDVLTICRSASGEVVGPTKTGRIRRITLGATAAGLWRATVATWRARNDQFPLGPWLFSPRPDHRTRLTASCLGHWFGQTCVDAGFPQITLHRLRHTVATSLVSEGHLLQAQYRLGHKDAATTLRTYSHVMPLTDADTAATLDALYR